MRLAQYLVASSSAKGIPQSQYLVASLRTKGLPQSYLVESPVLVGSPGAKKLPQLRDRMSKNLRSRSSATEYWKSLSTRAGS